MKKLKNDNINKKYFINVLEDLRKFLMLDKLELEWNQANNLAAEEWNQRSPKTKKDFEEFYKKSTSYIDAMATYCAGPKKRALYSKIFKIIKSLKGVDTIVDYGCGVGSDALQLSNEGYKIIAMDLPSIAFNFVKYRIRHNSIENINLLKIGGRNKIPQCDLLLSLDTLEHVFAPFETLIEFFKANPKYLLITTAFGIHETDQHQIPMHTDYSVHKIEKFIEDHGYEKQKLNMAFPPRLFIRKNNKK